MHSDKYFEETVSPSRLAVLLTRNLEPVTIELTAVEVAATVFALPTSSSVVRSAEPAVACSLRLLEDAVEVTLVIEISAVLLM